MEEMDFQGLLVHYQRPKQSAAFSLTITTLSLLLDLSTEALSHQGECSY